MSRQMMLNNIEYLEELRKEINAFRLPKQVNTAFHELLTATWKIAIGDNLKSCDQIKAAAYKGAVSLSRCALDHVLTELTNGRPRRPETDPVPGEKGTSHPGGVVDPLPPGVP